MESVDRPLDGDFACYRTYLLVLARLRLHPLIRSKIDPSDLVQDVLIKAHQAEQQVRARSEQEMKGWLRSILANALAEAMRRFGTQKRDAGLERSLEQALEESSARLERILGRTKNDPGDEAARHEMCLLAAEALEKLPEEQRTVIELHHLEGLSMPEVAAYLNRSTASVAGLLRRGLEGLRKRLGALS